jgi:hypothetical protein
MRGGRILDRSSHSSKGILDKAGIVPNGSDWFPSFVLARSNLVTYKRKLVFWRKRNIMSHLALRTIALVTISNSCQSLAAWGWNPAWVSMANCDCWDVWSSGNLKMTLLKQSWKKCLSVTKGRGSNSRSKTCHKKRPRPPHWRGQNLASWDNKSSDFISSSGFMKKVLLTIRVFSMFAKLAWLPDMFC